MRESKKSERGAFKAPPPPGSYWVNDVRRADRNSKIEVQNGTLKKKKLWLEKNKGFVQKRVRGGFVEKKVKVRDLSKFCI